MTDYGLLGSTAAAPNNCPVSKESAYLLSELGYIPTYGTCIMTCSSPSCQISAIIAVDALYCHHGHGLPTAPPAASR
jgi:hypothetical protein